MSIETQKLDHTKHLCNLYESIKTAKTQTGAAYLSCVMGMWSQEYNVSYKRNPFLEKQQNDLVASMSSWWAAGWNANFTAKNGNGKLLELMRKKEEEEDEKRRKKKRLF